MNFQGEAQEFAKDEDEQGSRPAAWVVVGAALVLVAMLVLMLSGG